MAIDTESKRRSITGILGLFTVPPVPDGAVEAQDRVHVSLLYAGITITSEILIDSLLTITFGVGYNPFSVIFGTGYNPYQVSFTI